MAKPRSISDLIGAWASAIPTTESCISHTCSSVESKGDVLYHYGEHWPLALVDRAENGKARAVYVNSNQCNMSGGFGYCTNSVQCDVRANVRAHTAGTGIPVFEVPMGGTGYVSNPTIRTRPREDDPEPRADWSFTVPTYFFATDPGPAPVNDYVGCKCGTEEAYSYQEVVYEWSIDARPEWDYLVPQACSYRATPDYRVWRNGVIKWRAPKSWETSDLRNSGTEEKVCESCLRHGNRLRAWEERMYGPRWGRNRGKGYQLYCEMMDLYGSEANWRQARLDDYRAVRAGRKAHTEWLARNTIPQSALSRRSRAWHEPMRHVPKLDAEGYPLRKDEEAYWKARRAEQRETRRRQREIEEQQRKRRAIERWHRSISRGRRPSFESIAAETVANLVDLRETITTGRES